MTLKVLHLASFIGNIGDNAMHDGAYRTRAEDLSEDLVYTRVEIRDFIHWQTRKFDGTFLQQANDHDLVIFGGDSLFQTWRDDTPTGTYLDAPMDFLDQIKKPLCLYGLGVDATRGARPEASSRCRQFLDRVFDRPNTLVSLRNDGSVDLIAELIGTNYASKMDIIPDGGLFASPVSHAQAALPGQCREFIAVNLAGDMPDVRFQFDGSDHEEERFCQIMAQTLSALLAEDPDLGCVFVPHIHSDLAIVAKTLSFMDDLQRRTRVGVAPYVQGEAWSANFDVYRRAKLVIAMRFHANLVPVGLGIPTISIDTHHKVQGLFKALHLENQCCTDIMYDKGQSLLSLSHQLIYNGSADVIARQREAVARERNTLAGFHSKLAALIKS